MPIFSELVCQFLVNRIMYYDTKIKLREYMYYLYKGERSCASLCTNGSNPRKLYQLSYTYEKGLAC